MVTVLYFAAVRELSGVAQDLLSPEETPATIGALRALLEQRHPAMAGRLGRVRFARNEQFAPDDTALEDGDEIALIPPVAGG